MYTVDIDTGGTMTDALVSDGARRHSIKVDTTPHDYTVSFLACLAEGAKRLGHADVESFLDQVRLIRWSSTITTNVLAERRGSKVGMLVSQGHESDLYGEGRSPVIGELIDPQSIIGLCAAPDAAEILSAVKKLLETGVRRICVTLKHAFPDSGAEIAIKRVIENQYPDHILGAVPVLLGSDMAQIGHDQTRAHYSLMNAYTHSQLATSLFKAEDLLRDTHRWNGPLLIGHTSGGVARIGKTKAVDTIESGPVFGTFGGAYMAREYGLNSVICFDVGGTTTKASVVRDGAPVFQRGGELMEVPVKASFALLRSAAIGGGSVARVKNGVLALGPESMGAAPGPACYGLGGNAATLTDALLCLGYLDPGLFMGGRRRLDVARSIAVIDKNIARPLDVSLEVAALAIRDEAVEMMAELVAATAAEAALSMKDTALFAFGGNGPVFGAFLADKLGLADVYAFDLGPVFSAFGSAVSDVVHVYERGAGLKWQPGAKAAILEIAVKLYRQAARDLRGEGFSVEAASHCFELEFGGDGDTAGKVRLETRGEPGEAWFTAAAAAITQLGVDLARHPLLLLRLSSRLTVGEAAQPKQPRTVQKVEAAKRPMRFNGSTAMPCPAHRWENMGSGESVGGPAMINGATLSCPIPPHWKLEVDGYGNAHLTRCAKLPPFEREQCDVSKNPLH